MAALCNECMKPIRFTCYFCEGWFCNEHWPKHTCRGQILYNEATATLLPDEIAERQWGIARDIKEHLNARQMGY